LTDYRGRFAPSATGPLHLGSIFAALLSFLHAKHYGGQWLIRIDDLDEARCKQIYADEILRCLEAFALEPDIAVVYQRNRLEAYQEAFDSLKDLRVLYNCYCSRRSLPKGPYAGSCAHRLGQLLDEKWAIRMDTNDLDPDVYDLLLGDQQTERPGDFIVKRRDGIFAYQLACAVDEHLDQVTHVIRGIDLLTSTPMQRLIMSKLKYHQPSYGHFPVIIGDDGFKLSKQTFARPIDWSVPGKTYAALARLLVLNDTPAPEESAVIWRGYFQSLDDPQSLIKGASRSNTFST
jgi:glutamyl-Q tRNA(Asp) synthetase